MKNFAFFTVLFSVAIALADGPMSVPAPSRTLKICYISMNNAKEFQVTKSFVAKLQKLTGKKWVEVTEFMEKGGNPEKILEAMIEKKQLCDGLVISGHHTGSFGGSRASGSLSVEFMERISCEKSKANWFESVNSLWLQGCRTLGAPGELGEQNVNLAEFHANRVNAVRNEDGLEQNQMQLAQEFSSLLDAQTPYATRFMKSFPQARLYGWTRTAPGEKKGSERSLPFHIHNVAIHLGGAQMKQWIQNPFDPNMTTEQAEIYLQALIRLLQKPQDAKEIKASLDGWVDHGKPNRRLGLVGFDNDDLASMPPLFGNSDETLPLSRELECKIRNGKSAKETEESVDRILSDPRLIALTFYTLKDVVSRNGLGNTSHSSLILQKMKSNTNLMNFLDEKLKSVHSSLVRKLEYYGFLDIVDTKRAQHFESTLRSKVETELLKESKENDAEARDYKTKIVEESLKSKLLSVPDVRQMFVKTQNQIFGKSLLSMAASGNLYVPDAMLAELITAIAPQVQNSEMETVYALAGLNFWSPGFSDIVEGAIKKFKNESANYISYAFEYILKNKYMPDEYLNDVAEFVVSKTTDFAQRAHNSNESLTLASIFMNEKILPKLRAKAVDDYVTALEHYASTASKEVFDRISNIFSYSDVFKEFSKNKEISEESKERIRKAYIELVKKAKDFVKPQEYARLLINVARIGVQEEFLASEIALLKAQKDKTALFEFLDEFSYDRGYVSFDLSEGIKELLKKPNEDNISTAIDLLFRSKIEQGKLIALYDELLKVSGESDGLTISYQIGASKFISAGTKKVLTQKLLQKNPDPFDGNEYYRLIVSSINPYISGAVTSESVMEALKKDPRNNQLRFIYSYYWLAERPQLQAVPAQLDAYLKDQSEDNLNILLFVMDASQKKISFEILRDLILRTLEVNSFTAEELGELRKIYRADIDLEGLKQFPYKEEIIKKINDKLSEFYK